MSASERSGCGARNRKGGRCELPPGWGTDHLGSGHCKHHGGSSPNGRKYAAKQLAASLALELDVEPMEALLRMVRRAAGLHAYWRAEVELLEPDQVIVRQWRRRVGAGGFVEESSSAELNIALRAEREAMADLVHFSQVAVNAGVAEWQVRVAEQWAVEAVAYTAAIRDAIWDRIDPETRRLFRVASVTGLRALEAGPQGAAA